MQTTTNLRDLVEQQLDQRWEEWARSRPNLAAAIDRTRLIEQTVAAVREDARFVEAMREADLDEAKLAAAAKVLELAQWLIGKMVGR